MIALGSETSCVAHQNDNFCDRVQFFGFGDCLAGCRCIRAASAFRIGDSLGCCRCIGATSAFRISNNLGCCRCIGATSAFRICGSLGCCRRICATSAFRISDCHAGCRCIGAASAGGAFDHSSAMRGAACARVRECDDVSMESPWCRNRARWRNFRQKPLPFLC